MNGISNNNNLLAILGGQQTASDSPFSVGNSNEKVNPEEFLKLLQSSGEEGSVAIDEFMAKALKEDPSAREAFEKAIKQGDQSIANELSQRSEKLLEENPQLKTLLKESKSGIMPDAKTIEAFSENHKNSENLLAQITTPKSKGSSPLGKIDPNMVKSEVVNSDGKVIEQNPRIPLDLKSSLNKANTSNAGQAKSLLNAQVNGSAQNTSIQTGSDFVSQMNVAQSSQGEVLPFETRAKNANALLGKVKGYGKNQNTINSSMFDINPADFNSKMSMRDDLGNSLEIEQVSGSEGDSNFDFLSSNLKKSGVESLDLIGPNTKVVDLSNIQATNKTELIQKITNYIEINKLENNEALDLLVKHDELGTFRVNARKAGPGNQIDLQIATSSKEGHQFFAENEVELIKSLDKSGVKLAQFKVLTTSSKSEMMSFSSDSKNSGSNLSEGSSQNQGQGSFGKGGSSEQKDSQRRKELWEQFKEQNQAFA
ncbi:MAG: hypothetical protein KC493_01930 [Bacteriovoracaceae bacterium]|nr:hypothetical protein [Bacteriovoracaceae bacterium]